LLLVVTRASGVGHARIASVRLVPGFITPVLVVCRAEEEASVVAAVGQSLTAPVRESLAPG
jgi:hypothetical protein